MMPCKLNHNLICLGLGPLSKGLGDQFQALDQWECSISLNPTPWTLSSLIGTNLSENLKLLCKYSCKRQILFTFCVQLSCLFIAQRKNNKKTKETNGHEGRQIHEKLDQIRKQEKYFICFVHVMHPCK
jgi:hypothetical protein